MAEEDKITDQVEEEEEGVEVETNQTISSKARDTWSAGGLDVPPSHRVVVKLSVVTTV